MRHLELPPHTVARAAITLVNTIRIYGPVRFDFARREILAQSRGATAGNASALTIGAIRPARRVGHVRGSEGWIEFPETLTLGDSSRMANAIAAHSWTSVEA